MLWGKVSVIKMVVAPQLNYVTVMVPVAMPHLFFKQYDLITKEFFWEGRKPRCGLRKIWVYLT